MSTPRWFIPPSTVRARRSRAESETSSSPALWQAGCWVTALASTRLELPEARAAAMAGGFTTWYVPCGQACFVSSGFFGCRSKSCKPATPCAVQKRSTCGTPCLAPLARATADRAESHNACIASPTHFVKQRLVKVVRHGVGCVVLRCPGVAGHPALATLKARTPPLLTKTCKVSTVSAPGRRWAVL